MRTLQKIKSVWFPYKKIMASPCIWWYNSGLLRVAYCNWLPQLARVFLPLTRSVGVGLPRHKRDGRCTMSTACHVGEREGGAHTRYLPLPPREKWGGELSIQVAATRTRAAFNYFLLGCLTHCVIPHNYTILDIKVSFRRVLYAKIIYLQNTKVKYHISSQILRRGYIYKTAVFSGCWLQFKKIF